MRNIVEKNYGNVTVIERSDYKWGVVDCDGNEIVPFGKYNWIDGFDQGLARVKIGTQSSNLVPNDNKWGIINEQGEEVVPVELTPFGISSIKDGIQPARSKRIIQSRFNSAICLATNPILTTNMTPTATILPITTTTFAKSITKNLLEPTHKMLLVIATRTFTTSLTVLLMPIGILTEHKIK